jgi:hypothetical protein
MGSDADIGESYERQLRITSMHNRTLYSEIVKISEHIDFRHPRFMQKSKRNRSLGSVQAFIVELALTDQAFLAKLRKYMIHGGRGYSGFIDYINRYD